MSIDTPSLNRFWRSHSESNRDGRGCNPLHDHSAMKPCLVLPLGFEPRSAAPETAVLPLDERRVCWSRRQDLNLRSPASKAGRDSRLPYAELIQTTVTSAINRIGSTTSTITRPFMLKSPIEYYLYEPIRYRLGSRP